MPPTLIVLRAALLTFLLPLLAAPAAAQEAARQPFTPEDLVAIKDLSEPVFAPDSERIVYVVTAQGEGDFRQSDLWTARWNGGEPQPLFATPEMDESTPRFSADGRTFAFVRSDWEDSGAQLWISRDGAEPVRASSLTGGVEDYALAPDGQSAILVSQMGDHVRDEGGTPPPIVIDRFTFKEDGRGLLDDRRSHLFWLDLASGETRQLTTGTHDAFTPAFSPDGRQIAYVSRACDWSGRRRCSDVYVMPATGGEARRISTFAGEDADPGLEAGGPQWSPDGTKLVWLRSGPEAQTWYHPTQLVVADVASGAQTMPAWIDRWFYQPRWSADGRHILALIEQDRDTWLAQIDPASEEVTYLTSGKRFAYDYAAARDGRIAVLDSNSGAPAGLRTVEPQMRVLADHNGWIAGRVLAETQDLSFMSDGVEIYGQLLLPPDHRAGQKHPLVVRLHGGPVYQFSHEFMADWQVLAAEGYAVLGINPRGSSGRGAGFAQAQMARWGTVDVADTMAGITHVLEMGVANPDAIGVGGWSYGGILSNYMIASDQRIKAAVAGAGMANFFGGYGVDQYARDYELEIGRPWEKPEAWMALSYPFFHADRITAATLYMCAAEDTNVPCAGSEAMYQALRSLSVPTALVVYPGQTHGLNVPSYIRDRMVREVEWYGMYLTGE